MMIPPPVKSHTGADILRSGKLSFLGSDLLLASLSSQYFWSWTRMSSASL